MALRPSSLMTQRLLSGPLLFWAFWMSVSQSNTISNNNIGAITIQGTGTIVGFRGIFVITATNQTTTVTNNTIGGAVAGGAITDTLVGPYQMTGILVARPNATITGNTIRNMSGKAIGGVVSTGIRSRAKHRRKYHFAKHDSFVKQHYGCREHFHLWH